MRAARKWMHWQDGKEVGYAFGTMMAPLRAFILGFAALFAAAPCMAAAVPPQSIPSTCKVSSVAPTPMSSDREGMSAWRQRTLDVVASLDNYVGCLNASLEALKARFKAEDRVVDPIVDRTVAEAVNDIADAKARLIKRYNDGVSYYNGALTYGHSADALDPLSLTLARPAIDARTAVAADAELLSMPSRAVGQTHNCTGYDPPTPVRPGNGGTTQIVYDVGADGVISDVRVEVAARFPDIDAAVLACVADRWRNMPAILHGVPVATAGYRAAVVYETH
jgi:hypothetical protein